MDRRTFLRGILKTAVIGAVATPALAELLTPKRTIFLPPRAGWIEYEMQRALQQLLDNPQRVQYSSAGIPQFLTNYMDPKLIEILVSPMRMQIVLNS